MSRLLGKTDQQNILKEYSLCVPVETFFSTHYRILKCLYVKTVRHKISMPPLSNFACYVNQDFLFCFDYKLHSFKKYTIHNKTACQLTSNDLQAKHFSHNFSSSLLKNTYARCMCRNYKNMQHMYKLKSLKNISFIYR